MAEAAGWKISRTGGGHWRLSPPSPGRPEFLPFSPSDHRAIRNCEAALRRRGLDVG